jgi:hypothetical protein
VIWLLRSRRFGPFRLVALALMAYRYWRRLSPERKAEITKRVRDVRSRLRPVG